MAQQNEVLLLCKKINLTFEVDHLSYSALSNDFRIDSATVLSVKQVWFAVSLLEIALVVFEWHPSCAICLLQTSQVAVVREIDVPLFIPIRVAQRQKVPVFGFSFPLDHREGLNGKS